MRREFRHDAHAVPLLGAAVGVLRLLLPESGEAAMPASEGTALGTAVRVSDDSGSCRCTWRCHSATMSGRFQVATELRSAVTWRAQTTRSPWEGHLWGQFPTRKSGGVWRLNVTTSTPAGGSRPLSLPLASMSDQISRPHSHSARARCPQD